LSQVNTFDPEHYAHPFTTLAYVV